MNHNDKVLLGAIHKMAEANEKIFEDQRFEYFSQLCTTEISIIEYVSTREKATAKKISIDLDVSKTTIVSAVSRLERRGFIIKQQNEEDKREQLLFLTDKGQKANEEHHLYEKLSIQCIKNLFRKEDYSLLIELLEKGNEA